MIDEEVSALEEIEKDQYLIFAVKSQEYAIQAMRVKEISAVPVVTQIPTAPPYIEGVLNLRGQLATVISFRKKFAFEAKERDEDMRIVIVEHGGFPIGILVDSVEEVIRITDDKILQLPEEALTDISREYIKGVAMLDKRLVIILDTDNLLTRSEDVAEAAVREAAVQEAAGAAGGV